MKLWLCLVLAFSVSAFAANVALIKSSTTADPAVGTYEVDTTKGNVAVFLPATGGGSFTVIKVSSDAHTVIVACQLAAATINGNASMSLTTQYQAITCVTVGSVWHALLPMRVPSLPTSDPHSAGTLFQDVTGFVHVSGG